MIYGTFSGGLPPPPNPPALRSTQHGLLSKTHLSYGSDFFVHGAEKREFRSKTSNRDDILRAP